MAIHARRNLYPGINAHLHSERQQRQRWKGFHGAHIVHLMEAMKAQLEPMGYTADNEESLQIRRIGDLPMRREPDVIIHALKGTQRPVQRTRLSGGVLYDSLMEGAVDLEHSFDAILISKLEPWQPVAWLELLSPTNKGDTKDAVQYLGKRALLLEQGLVLIELDYLHETPPTFIRWPDYTRHQPEATPYRVAVVDPGGVDRPAEAYIKGIEINGPLPVVDIPLLDDDVLTFDFGQTYKDTFMRARYGSEVDYAQLPPGFETYWPEDQLYIARLMLAAQTVVASGGDLETAELALPDVSLEQALAQIAALLQE